VPNTLTLSLYVLMAAWFALNGVRRWGTVERGLRELAARRWVVIVSRLVRVAAVPSSCSWRPTAWPALPHRWCA